MAYLSVRSVTKSFGDRQVLAGASLEAESGDTVAVLGPSGSGKSTLLNIIGALLPPDNGEVIVAGTDVVHLSSAELAAYRANKVGFVFQDHHLLPQLTLMENVLLPALAARTDPCEARAAALLERVGLKHRLHAYPWQVSGGERQRAALARALMNEPGLLLCDEPTGNLDQPTGAEVMDLLLSVARDDAAYGSRTLILMVTHNLDHAARFDRRLRLEAGSLKEIA